MTKVPPPEFVAWADRLARERKEYDLAPLSRADVHREVPPPVDGRDALLLACRRGEREVQITRAFADKRFSPFPRPDLTGLALVTLTRYHKDFASVPCLFEPLQIDGTLGEAVASCGWEQIRLAESEKFAHITRFFNGGRDDPFPGEARDCVPSPRGIPFDRAPEMAAASVADRTARAIASGRYPFVAVNFANGDVCGHLDAFEPKRKAAEAVDRGLGVVIEAAAGHACAVLVCADHGALETGFRSDGAPNVSHTTVEVPCVLALPGRTAAPAGNPPAEPALRDVAPTLCALLGISAPDEMDGRTLFDVPDPPGRAVLVVLDGWGIGPADGTNPIHVAATPVWDRLGAASPDLSLAAAGEAVGLLAGKAGNSEAGHLNLGAGRIVPQDDRRIEQAVADGTLETHPALRDAVKNAAARGGRTHVLGLLSDRSSHGTWQETAACVRGALMAGAKTVWLHLVLDGRSAPPGSAPGLMRALGAALAGAGDVRVATVMGRAYALDRDGNWDAKTRVAFEAITAGRASEERKS